MTPMTDAEAVTVLAAMRDNRKLVEAYQREAQALNVALARMEAGPGLPRSDVLEGAMADLASWRCADGYCDFGGKATGQHTNGGCKCLSEIRNPSIRARLRAVLRAARAASPPGAQA